MDLICTADISVTGLRGLRAILRETNALRGTGRIGNDLANLRGYAKLVQDIRRTGIRDAVTPTNIVDLLERADARRYGG